MLDWRDPKGTAHHYQIQVSTNNKFYVPVIDESTVSTSSFTPASDLTPGRLYYWRVRAFNLIGTTGGWSSVRIFKTPLARPVLIAPSENQSLLTDRPVFEWAPVPGATSYTLQVAREPSFNTLLVNTTLHTVIYSMPRDLPQNRTLYWRVRARTFFVNGPWSDRPAFKTGNPPGVPVLESPVHGSLVKDSTPFFNWNNSRIPVGTIFKHYQVQVDNDASFSSPVIDTTTFVSSFTPLSELESNTRFYWRVRAVNLVGEEQHLSGWSLAWSLRTVILAPQSLIVLPNVLNPLRPTLDWADATGTGKLTGYTIQISTQATFSSLLVNRTTIESQYALLKNLPSGKTLYWRVRANGTNGPSAWSTAQFALP